MYINTQVVRALMALRRIDESTLANIANITTEMFSRWLHDDSEEAEELVAFDTQLEILRVLGINGETPRNDIVHYWYLHEPFFSRSANNYGALNVLTQAFGKVEAIYFAKESDPLMSMSSKSHFGLQFPSFKAVLEVTAHPLRNIGFDPRLIADAKWADGTFGVLLAPATFPKLAPGLITPTAFESQLNETKEVLAWERLSVLAKDNKISADQLELILMSVQQGLNLPKLAEASRNSVALASAEVPTAIPDVTETVKPDVTLAQVAEEPAPTAAKVPNAPEFAKVNPKPVDTTIHAVATPQDSVADITAGLLRSPTKSNARVSSQENTVEATHRTPRKVQGPRGRTPEFQRKPWPRKPSGTN